MRNRFGHARSTYGAVLLAGALAIGNAHAQTPANYHPPSSPAERALDTILKRVDADRDVLDNLLPGVRKPGSRPTVDCTGMLTEPLLRAIAAAERGEVRRNCGGHHVDGEICGLDFVPVTCAQDSNDHYLYDNEIETATAATIAYVWRRNASPVATFRLVKLHGVWKIDGIRCGLGLTLNMP